MQYSSERKKKNITFYVITAICLAAIMAVSYLASANKNADKMKEKKKDELSGNESSYNSSSGDTKEKIAEKADEAKEKAENEISRVTDNTVKTEPYTEKKPQENQNTETAEKQTFVLPIKGNIIKGFSDSELQFDKTYGDMRIHEGIDIACEENAKLVSAAKGTVSEISESAGFGTCITVEHIGGITVKYCGVGSASVKKGQSVNAGDLLGTVKTPVCECADESHIHIECFKEGKAFSPLTAFGY